MSEKVSFKAMMQDRQFMKLFVAGVISRFGDAVDMIAYGYMVYAMTGSAVLMATLYAVNGIPSLVVNFFSGVLVTYMPKKRVVFVCDILRGSVVTLTAILYFTGGLEVWHLYLFTVLNSTFEAFRQPAAASMFAQLVADEKLEHATSLNSSGRMLAELIGYATGPALIAIVGVSGAILVDGLTFLIAGIIISVIMMDKEVIKKEKLDFSTYRRDLAEGFGYVFNHKLILSIALFGGGMMFLLSPFNALQTPYILDNMAMGPLGISVLSMTFMVAMIVSSLLVPMVLKRTGSRKAFIYGGSVVGIGYFLFGTIEVFSGSFAGYIALAGVSIIMGSAVSFMNMPIQIAFMRHVDKTFMPRVSSVMSILMLSSVPLGGALVGALVAFVEIRILFFITGAGVVLLFLSQLLNKALYQMDQSGDDSDPDTAEASAEPVVD